jgi:hypothetical protein
MEKVQKPRNSQKKTIYNLTYVKASKFIHVRVDVFTAVTMKIAAFWDVAPSKVSVNRL